MPAYHRASYTHALNEFLMITVPFRSRPRRYEGAEDGVESNQSNLLCFYSFFRGWCNGKPIRFVLMVCKKSVVSWTGVGFYCLMDVYLFSNFVIQLT